MPGMEPDATAGPAVRLAMQSMQDVGCIALETIIDILCLDEHVDTCMTSTVNAPLLLLLMACKAWRRLKRDIAMHRWTMGQLLQAAQLHQQPCSQQFLASLSPCC